MRSTISPDCATARRSPHDTFPGDGCARQTTALGCAQASPVPQVRGHLSEHLVRRADMSSLQKLDRLAQRRAARVPCSRQWTLEIDRLAVESHKPIEEPEEMNLSDRGLKHLCPKCTTKYYDLGKPVVACPICGAKPPAAKLPKVGRPARKPGRSTFGRFP